MDESLSEITPDSMAKLVEYLKAIDDLEQREPKMFTDIEHDTEPSDEWNAWNDACRKLDSEYSSHIWEVLKLHLRSESEERSVVKIIKSFIDGGGRKTSAKEKAIERGALMTLGSRVLAYTEPSFKDSLNGYCIKQLPSNIETINAFDDYTGRLNNFALGDAQLENLSEYRASLFFSIAEMVHSVSVYDDTQSNTIEFYIPTILSELGIDPRPYSSARKKEGEEGYQSLKDMRRDTMLSLIMPYDRLVGITPNGNYYRLMAFDSYDSESETMKVNVPYFFAVKMEAERLGGETPKFHKLLHGNVANEPNQGAVELASRIISGIERRGSRNYGSKDSGVVTYRVKYSTLIDDCPLVLLALQNTTTPQAYNSKLKQIFQAAYRIIERKSDLPLVYKDLELPTTTRTVSGKKKTVYKVPTKSILNTNLIITHKGKRKKGTA